MIEKIASDLRLRLSKQAVPLGCYRSPLLTLVHFFTDRTWKIAEEPVFQIASDVWCGACLTEEETYRLMEIAFQAKQMWDGVFSETDSARMFAILCNYSIDAETLCMESYAILHDSWVRNKSVKVW